MATDFERLMKLLGWVREEDLRKANGRLALAEAQRDQFKTKVMVLEEVLEKLGCWS